MEKTDPDVMLVNARVTALSIEAALAAQDAEDVAWLHRMGPPPSDDGLGSDYSGVRAHMHLELHLREYREWRAEIRASLGALNGHISALQQSIDHRNTEMQKALESRLAEDRAETNQRLSSLSSRMWTGLCAFIGTLLMIAGYLYDKGKFH
jgi:hypothetical protein